MKDFKRNSTISPPLKGSHGLGGGDFYLTFATIQSKMKKITDKAVNRINKDIKGKFVEVYIDIIFGKGDLWTEEYV